MTDGDRAIRPALNGASSRPERLMAFDHFTAADDQPADVATGLVSLGYITAAIRRSTRFWCALAIIGMLVGVGLCVKSPPAYKASTSVLLTYGPEETPTSAVLDNQTIAESHAVAQLAMRKVGLQQSVGSFAAAYTVAVVTNRVLLITMNAPSSSAAVSRANAVAGAFLQLRAQEMQAAQKLVLSSLDQEVSQARQNVASITAQISQESAQPSSPAQRASLKNLRTQLGQANTGLGALAQTAAQTQASTTTLAAIKGSVVLDGATPLAHSRLKYLLLYALTGLIAGLALGMVIVAVRAIASDRLRRRDDVARALGTPVKLSVGPVRLRRWLPGAHGLAAARRPDIQQIATHLRSMVSVSSRGTANLAVVPVDDPVVPALSLVALAMSFAQQGRRVVLADLAGGAPAAKLLDAAAPGVRPVSTDGAQLIVAVPGPDDLLPIGPLGRGRAAVDGQHSAFTDEVRAACGSADVLLTLVALDPSVDGQHLATWAANAVAVVTAGQSSWTRIHAAGEMIRLDGMSLVSTVLVGADKADESLGTVADSGDLIGVSDQG